MNTLVHKKYIPNLMSAHSTWSQNVSAITKLAAGGTISVTGFHNSGANDVVLATQSYLSITKVS